MSEQQTQPPTDREQNVHQRNCPVACGWRHASTDAAALAMRIQQHMRDRHPEAVTPDIGIYTVNQPVSALSPDLSHTKPAPSNYPPPPYPPKSAEWIDGYRQGMAHCLATLQPLLDADAGMNTIRQAVRALRGQMPEPSATPPE